jgi:hypothetical protein
LFAPHPESRKTGRVKLPLMRRKVLFYAALSLILAASPANSL